MARTLRGISTAYGKCEGLLMDIEQCVRFYQNKRLRQKGRAFAAQLRRTADKVDSYVRSQLGAE